MPLVTHGKNFASSIAHCQFLHLNYFNLFILAALTWDKDGKMLFKGQQLILEPGFLQNQ